MENVNGRGEEEGLYGQTVSVDEGLYGDKIGSGSGEIVPDGYYVPRPELMGQSPLNGRGEEEGLNGQTVSVDEGLYGDKNGEIVPDGYYAPLPGFMGPPRSPRATHSPLIFTPQLPGIPLQKPDEIQSPSNSSSQTTVGYEDVCNEQGIPTMITWNYGGKDVAVEGSWDNWKTRIPLQRSGKDHTIMKVLPAGVYQYRFIVDRQWRYIPELPWAQDDSGNAYNILDL